MPHHGGNVAVNSTGAETTVGVGTNLTVEGPDVASPWRTPVTVAHVRLVGRNRGVT